MFRQNALEILINVLLGFAWGISLLGAIVSFDLFYGFGLVTAIVASLIGSLFGIFMVLSLEFMLLQIERNKKLDKQNENLEKILHKLDEKLSNN